MKKLLVPFFCFFVLMNLDSQDSDPKPTLSLSGSLDAYFRADLNSDFDQAPATAFANLPGFSLGMANIIGTIEGKKVGASIDLVFGPRGEDATFLSPVLRPGGNSSIINQLYLYWNITEKTKITIGNFNTFLGYEVISPTGNFNYSTSYMFSYGPFSHTGLKLDFDLGSGFTLMTGVFNPTDATEFNVSNDYVGGAQLGYDFGSGSVFVNTLFDDDFFQIDLTAGVDLSDKLYLGVNATSASDAFKGIAGYLQLQSSDALKIGIRTEYFKDNGVGAIAPGESAVAYTLSANYKINDLTIIPEFRLDNVSMDVFSDGIKPNSSLSSFVLAAIYNF